VFEAAPAIPSGCLSNIYVLADSGGLDPQRLRAHSASNGGRPPDRFTARNGG
jgi:hypothetical protein